MNLIGLYELFHKKEGAISLEAITQLQIWGVIAQSGNVKCPNGHIMELRPQTNATDGYAWRCRKMFKNPSKKRVKCESYTTIRHNTFFNHSQLSIFQVISFTYLWTKNATRSFIMNETKIASQTASDWASYHREVVYDAMTTCHTPIGGIGKTVEVDELELGKRKYHRSNPLDGEWVFGGVESESGKSFLVPVDIQDKETLLKTIKEWIQPGTTIISDCWKKYDSLGAEGFQHQAVKHSFNFKDNETGARTNTVESMWRQVKASLSTYNRKKQLYGGYLAKYMFLKKCQAENSDPLEEFYKYAGILYDPERFGNQLSYESDDSLEVL